MLNRSAKAAYFGLFRYPMRLNAWRHRLLPGTPPGRRVHLGPGQRNYLPDWTNVDANFLTAKIDVWADIGGKLPFRSGTVAAFYSHHVIEHLPDARLPFHFKEMYRALLPGGAIRIAGPNADAAIARFQAGDCAWFSDFPLRRRSIGGRFANFILCGGDHLAILTASYLTELAADAGFEHVSFCAPVTQTNFPEIFEAPVLAKEWESSPDCPHTLVMEARKPS